MNETFHLELRILQRSKSYYDFLKVWANRLYSLVGSLASTPYSEAWMSLDVDGTLILSVLNWEGLIKHRMIFCETFKNTYLEMSKERTWSNSTFSFVQNIANSESCLIVRLL